MTKNKNWYLGFFGFFALMAIPGLIEGELVSGAWLVWLVWFSYFIPSKKDKKD